MSIQALTRRAGTVRLLERSLIARERQTYSITDAGRRELTAVATVSEFTSSPSSPRQSELTVNWDVNYSTNDGKKPHQGAEFTEFTADQAEVHPVHRDSDDQQFTEDTALECSSSPQFTASSPSSSPSQFTSSPPVCSLEHGQGELEKANEKQQFTEVEGVYRAARPDPRPLTPLSDLEPIRDEVFAPPRSQDGLPPGWQWVKCDHAGTPGRYGVYWKAEGPHGATTEPSQHRDDVLRDARNIVAMEVRR